jgi:hypothetical protein
LITGSHPRHRFIASRLAQSTNLIRVIFEDRGPVTPEFVSDLSGRLATVAHMHYNDRENWEDQYVPLTNFSTQSSEFSSWTEVGEVISKESVDVVFTFGCTLVPSWLIGIDNVSFINFHGGMSPWYRGTLTTFWPSYLLQPEKTGYTVHETTQETDGGCIYARIPARINSDLSLNRIAFEASLNFAESLDAVATHLERSLAVARKPREQGDGKLFLNSDWSPALLLHIYEEMQNRPVAYASQFRAIAERKIEFL